ncbi:MAG: flippase [Desulfobacterales bacterium]|nr:flippase [Desulfobacterales bacterium]
MENTLILSKINKILNHPGFRRYSMNTMWMVSEQILRLIAGLFVGIWVARYLGPGQFGLLNYAVAFTVLFGVIAKLGLDAIIVRDLVNQSHPLDVYLGTAFWLKAVGASVAMSFIAMAVRFTANDVTTNGYIFIIAAGLIFQSFEVIEFYFQSQVLVKFVSICKMVQLSISSVLKIYMVLSGSQLISFVLLSLFDNATLALSLFVAYQHQRKPDFIKYFDLQIARTLLKDSWPLILSSIVIMIYMRIDLIMIKEMLGEHEVGVYSAAVRLGEVWYFIPVIIATSFFPAILNAKKQSETLYYSRLKRLYAFMAWFAIIIALSMSLLSDRLVILLYGAPYSAAGRVLTIHIWSGVFVFVGVVSGKWLLAENLQLFSTINTSIGAIANVILNYVLIPKIGIIGSAWATLISYFIAAYLCLAFSKRTRINFFNITKSIFLIRNLNGRKIF